MNVRRREKEDYFVGLRSSWTSGNVSLARGKADVLTSIRSMFPVPYLSISSSSDTCIVYASFVHLRALDFIVCAQLPSHNKNVTSGYGPDSILSRNIDIYFK